MSEWLLAVNMGHGHQHGPLPLQGNGPNIALIAAQAGAPPWRQVAAQATHTALFLIALTFPVPLLSSVHKPFRFSFSLISQPQTCSPERRPPCLCLVSVTAGGLSISTLSSLTAINVTLSDDLRLQADYCSFWP